MKDLFNISTITPLFIGDDKILSPYSDYIYKNGKVNYIDQNLLMQNIPDDRIDYFIEQINKSAAKKDNSKKFRLEEFIEQENIDIDKITKYSAFSYINPKAKQIKRFISTSGRIFIPGTSIKGALRTAVIYDYLKNTNDGENLINKLIEQLTKIEHNFSNKKNAVLQIENKLKFEKNYRNKKELFRSLNKILYPFQEQLREIIKNIETNPFGKDAKADFFKTILVSDTNTLFPEDCIYIDEIKRVKLKSTKPTGTPFLAELLQENTNLKFSVKQNKINENIFNKYYFSDFDINKLFQLVNRFSKDQLQNQLKSLPYNYHYNGIKKKIKDLLNLIENNIILIRIGANKTFFYNTIMSLLPKEQFNIFREIFRIGKNSKTNQLVRGDFPATQAFLFDNNDINNVLGWCRIDKAAASNTKNNDKEKNIEINDDMISLLSSKFKVSKK